MPLGSLTLDRGRAVARLARTPTCLAVRVWAALCLSPIGAAGADRPPIVASRGAAFIAHQAGSDLWSIGSEQLEVVIGFDSSRTLALQRILNPVTGRSWQIAPAADVTLTAGGERLALTMTGAVSFVSANSEATEHGVKLTFNFEHRAQRLVVSRVYACYPGSPTIETWTRVTGGSSESTALTDLVGWQMTMPVGHVRWLGGLRGDSAAGDAVEDAFVVADRDLDPDERIELGSDGRSSESFVPLLFVGNGEDEFYGGLMWSGSWRAALQRTGERLQVSVFFPGITTAVTLAKPLEVPHTFFGVAPKTETNDSAALHDFIVNGIRRGRPFTPLVTYNTWFPYGTQVNEEQMVAEIERAAAIGVELVVLDAGWYVASGTNDDYDFESGLGTWAEDQFRFPSGIASLADYAHDSGLKFGIWVEPERVALAWVDKGDLARESWLATRDGNYGNEQNAQICLASAGRQWVLDRLTALIDRVRPDYLKWDNNFWINCNREGHGHGPGDGNLAHVQALYDMLEVLRRRYPDLLIENVSGGGARIDFGMLAFTDVAWMDDRTSPAARVRHNIEGLTFAFPPAYLLSFVIDSDGEEMAATADLPLLTRSRMPAVFGLTYRTDLQPEETAEALASEIQDYKKCRDIIASASATLLTQQTPYDDSGWDVLQEVANDGLDALIFGFRGELGVDRVIIHPRGLRPTATYDVMSLGVGPIGTIRGDALMEDGIALVDVGGSRAHVLVLQGR